jgi:hypothetical protein
VGVRGWVRVGYGGWVVGREKLDLELRFGAVKREYQGAKIDLSVSWSTYSTNPKFPQPEK